MALPTPMNGGGTITNVIYTWYADGDDLVIKSLVVRKSTTCKDSKFIKLNFP